LTENKRQDWILLSLLVIAAIGFGRWQTAARNMGETDLPSKASKLLVEPPAKVLGSTLDGVGDWAYGVFHAGALVAENRKLRSVAAVEALYNERLTTLNSELNALKKLQGYPAYDPKKRVPARVIGIFPMRTAPPS